MSDQVDFDSEVIDEVKEPQMFNVILLNDNYTTMDFVVAILTEIFHKSEDEAMAIMWDVHEKGSGLAGTYTEDIAATKSDFANKIAYEAGYPLKTKIQPVR